MTQKNEAAKAAEIEITPEMIQAGTTVLEDSGRLWGRGDLLAGDEILVSEIFLEMYRHLPLAHK